MIAVSRDNYRQRSSYKWAAGLLRERLSGRPLEREDRDSCKRVPIDSARVVSAAAGRWVMPSRNWKFVSLIALLAGLTGCGETAVDRSDGRLEVVIRPDSMAASGRPLRGSFLLHGLDQSTQARIDVDAYGYLSRSVSLAPGSYALQWQPALDLDALGGLDPAAEDLGRALTTELRVQLLIAAGRVTTVNVRSTQDVTRAARVIAAGAVPPESERLAQY
jgi:hypothetical protein